MGMRGDEEGGGGVEERGKMGTGRAGEEAG